MNKQLSGMMLSEISFTNMPIILKNIGFNFFIIDYEHGGFEYSDISKIIMSAKLIDIKVFVRIADNNRKDIIKFMDMGADGLILPMTNTPDDIKQVVQYAKYAPLGKRGISTMRAHTLYNPRHIKDYMKEANASTKIYAQIETELGLKNFEDILSIPGVDGFFLGPNDLSSELNCLDEKQALIILNIIGDLASRAKKIGKTSGIITNNDFYIDKAKAVNYDMYSVGSELSMLKSAGQLILDKIRK